jgi:hypothetical protein
MACAWFDPFCHLPPTGMSPARQRRGGSPSFPKAPAFPSSLLALGMSRHDQSCPETLNPCASFSSKGRLKMDCIGRTPTSAAESRTLIQISSRVRPSCGFLSPHPRWALARERRGERGERSCARRLFRGFLPSRPGGGSGDKTRSARGCLSEYGLGAEAPSQGPPDPRRTAARRTGNRRTTRPSREPCLTGLSLGRDEPAAF